MYFVSRIAAMSAMLLAGLYPVSAPADSDMDRLDEYLAATSTLQGEFSQVLLDARGQILSESGGTMSIKRPGRFRWHYTVPEELLVLGDGEQIWSYDVELENVTVAAQAETLTGNPAALLAGSGATEAFELVRAWQADGISWLELTPRENQGDFRHVRLGFAETALVMMELDDQLGQTTRIAFDSIEQNAPVDDTLFVFTPPNGVDVIQAGGLAR